MIKEHNGRQRIYRNCEDYALDVASGLWKRLTNRNWHEFSIRREQGIFVLEHDPKPEVLLPLKIQHTVVPCEGKEDARFIVAGVPVSVTVRVSSIEILVEGEIPGALSARLTEEIRANVEADIHCRCILE